MKNQNENDEELYDAELEEEKFTPKMWAGLAVGTVVLIGIFSIVVWNITHIKDDRAEENLEADTKVVSEVVSATIGEKFRQGCEQIKIGIAQKEEPKGDISETEEDRVSVEDTEAMGFIEHSDTVTAKDVTNLRLRPSTSDEANIVGQLLNGEELLRTGVNTDTGWSRLEYDGQVVYAVTNYLTTDLSYKPATEEKDPNRIEVLDGRVILFSNCDDYVAPKEYVNLRTEPSTSQGEATVRCQINYGTVVHRTGYSTDSGWSRVEYNGEILYVVSSMVFGVEAP